MDNINNTKETIMNILNITPKLTALNKIIDIMSKKGNIYIIFGNVLIKFNKENALKPSHVYIFDNNNNISNTIDL